jgi:hypothetical protein
MATRKKPSKAQTLEEEMEALRAEVSALRARLTKPLIKPFIIPTAIYSRDELAELTGFSARTIEREDQEGRLKAVPATERNKKYLGEQVLTWLGYSSQVPMQIIIGDPATAGNRRWPPKPQIKAMLAEQRQKKEKGSDQ